MALFDSNQVSYGPWQGGKVAGSLTVFGDKRKCCQVVFQRLVNKNARLFHYDEYGSKDQAILAAKLYQKTISDQLGLTKNMYRYVTDTDSSVYLEVQLNDGYIMKCEPEQLDIVNSRTWSIVKSCDNFCWYAANSGRKHVKAARFHNLAYPQYREVDHINRDGLDNRRKNVREGAGRINPTNRRTQCNNTSGVIGVHKTKSGTWCAKYTDINGNHIRKSFSISKHGEEEAFRLACEYREENSPKIPDLEEYQKVHIPVDKKRELTRYDGMVYEVHRTEHYVMLFPVNNDDPEIKRQNTLINQLKTWRNRAGKIYTENSVKVQDSENTPIDLKTLIIPKYARKDLDPDVLTEMTRNLQFPFPTFAKSKILSTFSSVDKYICKFNGVSIESTSLGSTGLNSFVLKHMLEGHREKTPSFLQAWETDTKRRRLFSYILSHTTGAITPTKIINAFAVKYGRLYNFPPTVSKEIYTHFNQKESDKFRTLDFCAGYAGRLTGFWFADSKVGSEYVGIDPNTEIPYKNIINFLSENFPRPDKSIKVLNKPAEDVNFASLGEFDLIFTSPPYFNREIYSTSETQSCMRYPKYKSWLINFLFNILQKCIDVLKPNGFLIINIKNLDEYPIADDMCNFLDTKLTRLDDISLIQPKLQYGNNKKNPEYFYCYQNVPETDGKTIDIEIGTEWTGGKPAGTIYKSHTSESWCVEFPRSLNIPGRNFNFIKIGSKELARKAADEYRVQVSAEHRVTKNMYRRVIDDKGDYLEVKLQDDFLMKCELEHLDLVNSYVWYAYKTRAKYVVKANDKTLEGKTLAHFFHLDAFPEYNKKIKHISGDGLDNRSRNIEQK